jgi:hypothetical protein
MLYSIGYTSPTVPFEIDLKHHTAILGQSGVGKSTVMVNSFIRLLQNGEGGVFIDPHGPAVDKIMRYIPRWLMTKVIYIDLLSDFVPGIIPQYKTVKEAQLFKRGFISMLYSLYKNRWGDETERIIKGALDAVTEYYGYINVLAIYLFIARDSFRRKILENCKNPLLQDFTQQYDEKLKASEQMSKFSPPLNKVDEFVEPLMRVAMSNERPIDWRRAMDDKMVIIVRVPKGEIGEEISKLIGSIIVLNIKIAALGRKESDPEFHVYIDECQNFLGAVDFETFASELRKYNVPLFLGTQYLDNFASLSALFGNFPNMILYRVSGTDAEILEKNYRQEYMANRLVELPDYHFWCCYKENGKIQHDKMIKSRAKTKKLGDEPPMGAVIWESHKRYGANSEKIDRQALEFLASPA